MKKVLSIALFSTVFVFANPTVSELESQGSEFFALEVGLEEESEFCEDLAFDKVDEYYEGGGTDGFEAGNLWQSTYDLCEEIMGIVGIM